MKRAILISVVIAATVFFPEEPSAEPTTTKRYIFVHEDRWGVVDEKLNVIVPPRFERLYPFSNCGYTVGRIERYRWQFIDRDGRVVYEIATSTMRRVYEGYAITYLRGRPALINVYGEEFPFPAGYVVVNEGFREGYAVIQAWEGSSVQMYMDTSGQIAFGGTAFHQADSFFEGLAVVTGDDGKMGVINTEGELVIDYRFWEVGRFREGLAYARDEQRIGYIDRSGTFVFVEKILTGSGTNWFDGGVAMALTDYDARTWRIIDREGRWVTGDLQIHAASAFSNGLSKFSIVADDDPEEWRLKHGFLNKSGEVVIEPTLDATGIYFEGEFNWFQQGDRTGMIDREGNKYWMEDILAGVVDVR